MKPTRPQQPQADLLGGCSCAVARVQGFRRHPRPQPPRDDLRPAGEVHRLQEGPRAAGALRGRGLHLLRPRGADRLDRPLRPGEGRHARAVRVDPHPRRRARRAPPPGLGPALAAPLGARHPPRPRAVHRSTAAARRARSSPTRSPSRQRPAPPRGRHRRLRRHLAEHARDLRRRDHGRAHRHAGRRRRRPTPSTPPTPRPRRSSAAPSTCCRGASARSPSCSTSRTSRCARSARSSASPRAASARSTRSSSARSSSSCPTTRCCSPPSAEPHGSSAGGRSSGRCSADRSRHPLRAPRHARPRRRRDRAAQAPPRGAASARPMVRTPRERPSATSRPPRREVLDEVDKAAERAQTARHNRELHFEIDENSNRVSSR